MLPGPDLSWSVVSENEAVYGWMDGFKAGDGEVARLVSSGKRTVGYMYCTAAPLGGHCTGR